jgi:hypothetical protein
MVCNKTEAIHVIPKKGRNRYTSSILFYEKQVSYIALTMRTAWVWIDSAIETWAWLTESAPANPDSNLQKEIPSNVWISVSSLSLFPIKRAEILSSKIYGHSTKWPKWPRPYLSTFLTSISVDQNEQDCVCWPFYLTIVST